MLESVSYLTTSTLLPDNDGMSENEVVMQSIPKAAISNFFLSIFLINPLFGKPSITSLKLVGTFFDFKE